MAKGPLNQKVVLTTAVCVICAASVGYFLFYKKGLQPGSSQQQDSSQQYADQYDGSAHEVLNRLPSSESPSRAQLPGTSLPQPGQEAQNELNAPSAKPRSFWEVIFGSKWGNKGRSKETSPENAKEASPSNLSKEEVAQEIKEGPTFVQKGCFSRKFVHKKMSSHSDGEACTQHQNILSLQFPEEITLNKNSICVRVNGTPVHFKKLKGKTNSSKEHHLLIGAVAGPNSVITARYCLGSTSCPEDCKVPKDDFMDAIGGITETGMDPNNYTHWESDKKGPGKEEKQLDRELAGLDKVLSGDEKMKTFKGWENKGDLLPACTKVAGKSGSDKIASR